MNAHRNCYSDSDCNQVRFQTQLGVLPGKIRTNLNIPCRSNIFNSMRRPTLHESNNEDLDSLIQMLQDGYEKKIKVSKPNDEFKSITQIIPMI
ncbi:hypothetical protein M9Y10_043897 [Tritrichomonas musculus]|uniref:Uncharacterized protein n=1 Tax=Tritrichomonas musculus TaxID=1915356 RepID=A0ABR2K2Q1_9EUKA